ncbi:DUF5985 family protein [Sphingomonas sp. MG17]|uniref:DUF5985 family protein n=1 Tax=Sphingomonas tagetis TaxID=2949092 RepID=A0A9X2HL22_9SPHN|nr:DUF5985 family protein [Sphingomonas tagetis]
MAALLPTLVYVLCFVTSALCALLLARNYLRTSARLLLWSALCFGLMAAANLLMVIDLVVVPAADLRAPRYLLWAAAVALLLFGFVWDLED